MQTGILEPVYRLDSHWSFLLDIDPFNPIDGKQLGRIRQNRPTYFEKSKPALS